MRSLHTGGWPAAALALAVAALLAGCGRGADSGATRNPNAPGSPGTGNPSVSVAPQQNDSNSGGSSGAKGSLPHPGSSGGDTVIGVTGKGTDERGGRSVPAQPGSGTTGGLGGTAGAGGVSAGTGTSGSAAGTSDGMATQGSPNSAPGAAFGTVR